MVRIYLLIKNPKKKNKKLDYIKVKLFFIKVKKKLLAIKSSYLKIPKYILYFI